MFSDILFFTGVMIIFCRVMLTILYHRRTTTDRIFQKLLTTGYYTTGLYVILSRLLFYSRSTFNLDPPLYATINCTVLFSVFSTVQLIVVYRGGSRLNVDLE